VLGFFRCCCVVLWRAVGFRVLLFLLVLSFGSFISAGLGLPFPFVGLGFWLYFLLWKCNFVAVVHGLGYPLSIPLI